MKTKDLRIKLKDARDDWNHGYPDDAMDKILDMLDILLVDREKIEQADERARQITEARAVVHREPEIHTRFEP